MGIVELSKFKISSFISSSIRCPVTTEEGGWWTLWKPVPTDRKVRKKMLSFLSLVIPILFNLVLSLFLALSKNYFSLLVWHQLKNQEGDFQIVLAFHCRKVLQAYLKKDWENLHLPHTHAYCCNTVNFASDELIWMLAFAVLLLDQCQFHE